jgi:hypothetical protein
MAAAVEQDKQILVVVLHGLEVLVVVELLDKMEQMVLEEVAVDNLKDPL